MTWWVVLFAISLAIRHEVRKQQRANRVSRNTRSAATMKRYEQDRPYPECFDDTFDDEMEDDL